MIFGRSRRKPIRIPVKAVEQWKYTTCNYCSTGCAIEIGLDAGGRIVTSRGHAGADVNRGKLCIKGLLEHELFDSPGRGTMPLMRDKAHLPFQPASWDAALDRTAAKIKEIQAKYGTTVPRAASNPYFRTLALLAGFLLALGVVLLLSGEVSTAGILFGVGFSALIAVLITGAITWQIREAGKRRE